MGSLGLVLGSLPEIALDIDAAPLAKAHLVVLRTQFAPEDPAVRLKYLIARDLVYVYVHYDSWSFAHVAC